MTDHLWTLIELIWTSAHAIGVLANIRLLGKALEKHEAALATAESATRDAELLTANRYVRNYSARLAFFGAGAFLGMWALASPDDDPLLKSVAGTVVVVMAFVPLINSIWDLTDEPAMDRILEREAVEAYEREIGRVAPSTSSILRELQERRRLRLAREHGQEEVADGPAE